MTTDIDKYFAEQCGVVLAESSENQTWHNGGIKYYWWEINDIKIGGEWTIKDPTCREIVRERFLIETMYDYLGTWESVSRKHDKEGQGKTIDEAEIACCEAIYEARSE